MLNVVVTTCLSEHLFPSQIKKKVTCPHVYGDLCTVSSCKISIEMLSFGVFHHYLLLLLCFYNTSCLTWLCSLSSITFIFFHLVIVKLFQFLALSVL